MVNGILNNINVRGGATATSLANAFVTRVEEDGGVVESQSCLTDRIDNLKRLGLWNKASVVWLPHGYKEGKLYAAKGGSAADLTITRAGTRTRKGPTYVEQVPYNLLSNSEVLTSTWVMGDTTPTQQEDVVIDGQTVNSWLVSATGLTNSGYQVATVNPLSDYTFTFYVKRGTATELKYGVYDATGASFFVPVTSFYNDTNSESFTKITVNFTTPASCVSVRVYIQYRIGDGTYYLAAPQLIAGSSARDYFPTTDRFDVPALDYTNDTCPALSLEPARTNLLLHSESFDNASWTKSNVTPTANNAIAPDGLSTADTILETTANNVHAVLQSITKSASATQYAYSIHVKGVGRTWIALEGYNGANGFTKYFDLTNVVVGSTVSAGAGFTLNSSSIVALEDEEDVPTGWYRCVVVFTTDATTALTVDCLSATADGTKSFIGDVTKGFIPWGAQLEAGSYATSYIPTTTATVSRIADAAESIVVKRTNLVRNSNDFTQASWTKTGVSVTGTLITDPLGGLTGNEILAASSAATQHNIATTYNPAPGGVTYVWSAYVKYINHRYIQLAAGGIGSAIPSYLNIDLLNGVITQQDSKNVGTITAEANGWYRVSMQMIATTGGNLSLPVYFIDGPTSARSANSTTTGVEKFGLWGAQGEIGSLTDLIITTTTPLHDGSIIGQTECTLYFEISSFADSTYKGILFVGDGTINNRLGVSIDNTNKLEAGIVVAGSTGGNGALIKTTTNIVTGQRHKGCFIIRATSAVFVVDGAQISDDLTTLVPPIHSMAISTTIPGVANNPFYGKIYNASILPTAITVEQAIALTAP